MSRYTRSQELYERACRSLAGGVSSEFRRYSHPVPLFYERAAGSRLWDVDGNEYLDFTLSQGPLLLGHSHPEVLQAVAEATARGQLFAGQHLAELELAEAICELVPCAELVRFSLSGSEAVHAALRVARAYTGRQRWLRFEGHYHGWFDEVAWSISAASAEALGPRHAPRPVPWCEGLGPCPPVVVLPWNDEAVLRETFARHGHELAAVITEPVMCNHGCIEPQPGLLSTLRELCSRHGTLLIFDEVITGFRLGLGGAQAYYGVTPDLAVFGKALASGWPLSVLAGRREVMQLVATGRVIHAGTMNSGHASVAAALATLRVMRREAVHARLFERGRWLMQRLAELAAQQSLPLRVMGPGPMFHVGFTSLAEVRDYRDTLHYDRARYAAFVQAMQARGIRLIGRGLWYLSAAHSEADLEHAARTAAEVLARQ